MTAPATDDNAALPKTFGEYLRSFGPGLVIVLTWLGAGDVVETGVAGANYGYALMWIIVLALLMRFLFVSLIAKYQLCNQRGEGVLDGLVRLHSGYAPFLLVAAILMGHVYGAYMTVGLGETWVNLTGRGEVWQWALAWSLLAVALAFRSAYRRLELVFKAFLALLSVSLLGCAIWAGPDPGGILRGTFGFALPERAGRFDSLLLAIGMLGAIGGSLMNLVYPYFLEQKGWRGPRFRRLQTYDFLLAMIVMIVLDLAVWTLGAELVHGEGESVEDLDGLTRLLGLALGAGGQTLFYLGVFAAVFTSVLGHAVGLASLASHAWRRCRERTAPLERDNGRSALYQTVVLWILLSPLVWTLPGMPDFVTLTLIANSLQVVLVPFLVGGLWWITASSRYIGPEYRNRWWENAIMALVFALSLWGMYGSVKSVTAAVSALLAGV